jgi:hypothetical protein
MINNFLRMNPFSSEISIGRKGSKRKQKSKGYGAKSKRESSSKKGFDLMMTELKKLRFRDTINTRPSSFIIESRESLLDCMALKTDVLESASVAAINDWCQILCKCQFPLPDDVIRYIFSYIPYDFHTLLTLLECFYPPRKRVVLQLTDSVKSSKKKWYKQFSAMKRSGEHQSYQEFRKESDSFQEVLRRKERSYGYELSSGWSKNIYSTALEKRYFISVNRMPHLREQLEKLGREELELEELESRSRKEDDETTVSSFDSDSDWFNQLI